MLTTSPNTYKVWDRSGSPVGCRHMGGELLVHTKTPRASSKLFTHSRLVRGRTKWVSQVWRYDFIRLGSIQSPAKMTENPSEEYLVHRSNKNPRDTSTR